MQQPLNTHAVGYAGLIGGGLSIVGATAYFFKVFSDPSELIALYSAAHTHTDPTGAIAKLAGAGIAIVGAVTVSLVAAYVGRPRNVK